jgi:hypothetical protein
MLQIPLNLIYLCKGVILNACNLRWFDSCLQHLSYTIDLEIAKFIWHIDIKKRVFACELEGVLFANISPIFVYLVARVIITSMPSLQGFNQV